MMELEVFQEKYCLGRKNFQLNPKNPEDSNIFAGREALKNQLKKRVTRARVSGAKLNTLLYGTYGGGKTHTLYYIQKLLKEKEIAGKSVDCYLFPYPTVTKGNFVDFYEEIMKNLGDNFVFETIIKCYDELEKSLSLAGKDLKDKIDLINERIKNRDLTKILMDKIRLVENDDLIWKWLQGKPCSPAEKKALGVTDDNSTPNNAIKTLEGFVKMYEKGNKEQRILVLLVDELEHLDDIKGEGRDITNGFRMICDQESLGFIGGYYAASLENMPIFEDPSLTTRIGYPDNYIPITGFDQRDAVEFVYELLNELRPSGGDVKNKVKGLKKLAEPETLTEKSFPFTEELIMKIINAIEGSGEETSDASPLTPRRIEMKLTDIVADALSSKPVPEFFSTTIAE